MATPKRPDAARPPVQDALQAYRAKRNFSTTPEPDAGGQACGGPLIFVVQKHWASSLHHDFRLELDGTLKSWAVPKEPSLDPKVKRMAVQVEDHPLAYASFEGTIPAGQYGAGKVVVWDAGTWVPLQDPQQGLLKGRLKFELQGRRLKGRWMLVRMKARAGSPQAWLLIKETDPFARASALGSSADDPAGRRPGASPGLNLPAEAVASALPPALEPQLATLAAGPPPDAAGWICEIKLDGYRLLVHHSPAGTRLLTRNGMDWSAKLLPLQRAFGGLGLPPGWYDGEIVLPGAAGHPDFGALQQAFQQQRTDAVELVLFDLPYCAGHDLRSAPLESRRALLKTLLAPSDGGPVRFSEAFEAEPHSMLSAACGLGLEGLIAKRRGSPYRSGRSADWLKLKCSQRQEFVIGGYTTPGGSRTGFGALLLGVHDAQGLLQYAGDVGTGFNDRSLKDLKGALDARARRTSPFAAGPKIEGKPHWVEPSLVAEVRFSQWTRAGRIRHAVFLGLRADKPAGSIERERAAPAATLPAGLQVSHPERVIDKRSGASKLDLVHYYSLVAGLMMKHLKGRPLALLRAPAGVDGQQFFQKHAQGGPMPGLRPLDPGPDSIHPPMLQVASRQGLLSAAQWNVIELHTSNASTPALEHPDRLVFDLDPGEGVAWAQVQEAALLVRAMLDQLGLRAFLKTSGGKGLHVVVPVKRLHTWDTARGFARGLVEHMAQTIPQRFVARSGPKNRVGRIFIDHLRNAPGATTVCAWSARARPGLGISVPVTWEELPSLRGGDHWTVQTVHQRLALGNEPWAAYARSARGLGAAIKALG